jgi:hypothetical protein
MFLHQTIFDLLSFVIQSIKSYISMLIKGNDVLFLSSSTVHCSAVTKTVFIYKRHSMRHSPSCRVTLF